MKLVSIPKDKYDKYRLDVIFDGYKWDPQFLDNNTIAKHVLIITEEEHKELERLTEKLDKETIQAEEMLNSNLKLAKPLALLGNTGQKMTYNLITELSDLTMRHLLKHLWDAGYSLIKALLQKIFCIAAPLSAERQF